MRLDWKVCTVSISACMYSLFSLNPTMLCVHCWGTKFHQNQNKILSIWSYKFFKCNVGMQISSEILCLQKLIIAFEGMHVQFYTFPGKAWICIIYIYLTKVNAIVSEVRVCLIVYFFIHFP